MVNPKLLESEDFYRALVKFCKRPEGYPHLPALLEMHQWNVTLDKSGAPTIQIQGELCHVEDAYRRFSANQDLFESFYDEIMGPFLN